MRLVIEVTESERDALRKYLMSFNPPPSYSALFRSLFRLALEGKVPRAALVTAVDSRPVLNVTLSESVERASAKLDLDAPIEKAEEAALIADFRHRGGKASLNLGQFRKLRAAGKLPSHLKKWA